MSPLQPKHEIVFGTPTTFLGDQIQQGDLNIVDYSSTKSNLISFSASSNDRQLVQTTNSRFRKRQVESREENDDVRRVMHRDVERKRRQEMSDLYVSLRSSLPIQQNKGKIPVCDVIQEAVDYIKHMQMTIQELRLRRDNMIKKSSKLSGTKVESSSGSDLLPDCVMVNHVLDGVEILISCSESSVLGLPRILEGLLEREFDVVSCVSTRTKEGFHHKIQIEARNMTSLDVLMLQERLTNAIK